MLSLPLQLYLLVLLSVCVYSCQHITFIKWALALAFRSGLVYVRLWPRFFELCGKLGSKLRLGACRGWSNKGLWAPNRRRRKSVVDVQMLGLRRAENHYETLTAAFRS